MPLYEYSCGSCGHTYEKREGFDAPSLQACPECGSNARRVLHPPPILFKGPGFYVTDNRKPSYGGDGRREALPSGEKAQLPAPSAKSDGDSPSEESTSSEAVAAK